MKFLITTLQFEETASYGGLAAELGKLGHETAHAVVSRRAAQKLRRAGEPVHLLPDLMDDLGPVDVAAESARIVATYDTRSLRAVFLTDPATRELDEAAARERTVRYFLALERIFDAERPDVLLPDVGSETLRTVAHLIALQRGVTTMFLFYTIFPDPLRLYIDTPHAPIVPQEEVRELTAAERAETAAFIDAYIQRDRPTLPYRQTLVTPSKVKDFARHIAVKATVDRDNDYLHPARFVTNTIHQRARARLSRSLIGPVPERPFVYFPLHVTDDFKVKRVIPHCVDQAYIIEQVADALPEGIDVVLKEHPVSIGRNPVSFLRRLVKRANVHLVDPRTSSHDLIRQAEAVVVISSTVGLEALLHNRPVMTMGQPFYAGYGITVDIDSFRHIPDALTQVVAFTPDRERVLQFLHAAMRSTYPGRPAGFDHTSENAKALARSLDEAARKARGAAPVSVTATG